MNKSEIAEKARKRFAFEQYAKTVTWNTYEGDDDPFAFFPESGVYANGDIQLAWLGWQWRERAIAESQAPQPGKLSLEDYQKEFGAEFGAFIYEKRTRELGDGEPSPPPGVVEVTERDPLNPAHVVRSWQRESGAAQEVSPPATGTSSDPRTGYLKQEEVSPPSPVRRFPIIGGPSIPWEVIEPHERQAQSNHDQTLRRLAERGGLSPAEAWFVLNDANWEAGTDWKKADEDGKALLNSINLRYERNGAEGDTRELKAALKEMTWLCQSLSMEMVKAEDYNRIFERANRLLGSD